MCVFDVLKNRLDDSQTTSGNRSHRGDELSFKSLDNNTQTDWSILLLQDSYTPTERSSPLLCLQQCSNRSLEETEQTDSPHYSSSPLSSVQKQNREDQTGSGYWISTSWTTPQIRYAIGWKTLDCCLKNRPKVLLQRMRFVSFEEGSQTDARHLLNLQPRIQSQAIPFDSLESFHESFSEQPTWKTLFDSPEGERSNWRESERQKCRVENWMPLEEQREPKKRMVGRKRKRGRRERRTELPNKWTPSLCLSRTGREGKRTRDQWMRKRSMPEWSS